MDPDRVASLDDPQLRVFAPLVAWSDHDLDADERSHVIATIAAQPWLQPAARAVLAAWLDPSVPPSAEELARLRTLIEHVSTTSSERARAWQTRAASEIASVPRRRRWLASSRMTSERLLAEVVPHAREVVEAFRIPDACLAAPIAFFDPAQPRYASEL